MHAFVYRLVERLTSEGPGLSRNRHFHTFTSPEGQQALRLARQLRSIARDIAASSEAPRYAVDDETGGKVRLEIPIVAGTRTAILEPPAWELLRRMPAVRSALSPASHEGGGAP